MVEQASLVTVVAAGAATAAATALGAVPFAFLKKVSDLPLAASGAVAAGLMLGASFGLMREGSSYGVVPMVLGGALGVLFILGVDLWLDARPASFLGVQGRGARRMVLVVTIMTLHSFTEGIAVGVSFGGGRQLAALITIAIAVHNIPEGLALSAVLRPRGASLAACAAWSVFSSLPQPLMAVPAWLFVEHFRPLLPYGLGFAAGAMVFMVFLELLPESYRRADKGWMGLLVGISLGLMILFQHYL